MSHWLTPPLWSSTGSSLCAITALLGDPTAPVSPYSNSWAGKPSDSAHIPLNTLSRSLSPKFKPSTWVQIRSETPNSYANFRGGAKTLDLHALSQVDFLNSDFIPAFLSDASCTSTGDWVQHDQSQNVSKSSTSGKCW